MFLVLELILVVDTRLDQTTLEVEVEFNVVIAAEELEGVVTHAAVCLNLDKRVVLISKAGKINITRLVCLHVRDRELAGIRD